MTKVGLVDEVGRSAEFIGDFGQGRLADTQPTQLIDVRGQRPDRPIDVWRGGAPGNGKISKSVIAVSSNGGHGAPYDSVVRLSHDG